MAGSRDKTQHPGKSKAARNADLADAIENAAQEMCLLVPGTRYEDYLRAGVKLGLPLQAIGREEEWLAARMAQRRVGGRSFELQLSDQRWLLISDQRLPDGAILTTGLDISDRKRIERVLADSEARFRDFASASGEWLWQTDAEGRFIWLSAEVEKYMGRKPEAHYGKLRVQEVIAARQDLDKEPWRSHLETLRSRQPFRDFRYRSSAAAGPRWLRASGVPYFAADGMFLGYRGSATDISREVGFEEANRRFRAAMDASGDMILLIDRAEMRYVDVNESVCRTLGYTREEMLAMGPQDIMPVAREELEAFSYSVSHDLRAPLRAIDGHAHLLAEREAPRLSAEGGRHLEAIGRNANRMGALVDALLDLSRVNRTELRRRMLDLTAIAKAIAGDLQAQHPRAEVLVGDMPMLEGDPVLVRQVLANLIGNALKYSAKNDAPRVEVGWDARHAACRIADNGVGFDMRHAGKLFGTFERLHTLSEFEGTGIGLAIVRRIVERHGGRAWAEAEVGRGARFYFTLGPR